MIRGKEKQLTGVDIPLKRTLNILLVDDDDICIFIHKRVAENSGLFKNIGSAKNGKTALEIINQAVEGTIAMPDIILLDLDMPVMNGLEFLEVFHRLDFKNKHLISIIVLTSSISEKDKEYTESLGVSNYLIKPFTLQAANLIVTSIFNNQ